MESKIRNKPKQVSPAMERAEERQIRFLRERNDAAIRLAREQGRRASSRFFLGEIKDDDNLGPLQCFARHLVDNLGEERACHIADGVDQQVARGITESVYFSGKAFQIYLDTNIAESQSVGSDIAVTIGAKRAEMLTREIRSRIADLENRRGKPQDDSGPSHTAATYDCIDDETNVARKQWLIWQKLSGISEVTILRIAVVLISAVAIALSVYLYAISNSGPNDAQAMNQFGSSEVAYNEDLDNTIVINQSDSPEVASDDGLDNTLAVGQRDSSRLVPNEDLDNTIVMNQSDSPEVASDDGLGNTLAVGQRDSSRLVPKDDLDNTIVMNQSDSPEVASDDGLDNIRTVEQSGASASFSIQVGAFKDHENAKDAYNGFVLKGYPARMEYPAPTAEGWHRVLVGRFHAEQDAMAYAEKLHKQEGIAYMIVHSSIR
jgi:hypothetical protein